MVAEFLAGNRITLLNSGAEYFPALLAAIDAAETEIYLESYIFADDDIGQAVVSRLCLAAARGVRVNVTVDGFGGRHFARNFVPRLLAAGVRAMLYRPELGRFKLRRYRLRRLHRKLVVIDARIAFVGGINMIDDHNALPEMSPRYDYAVRVEGPVLLPMHQAARRLWEMVAWVNFKHRFRSPAAAMPCCGVVGEQCAAFLIRDNIRHRNDILNAYIEAINQAHSEILIANAYFMPGLRFGLALQAAARRGVKITILLQGKTDHPFMRFATQAMYARALASGIRIFEYEKSFMHAKVAVIDDLWATVGSSNIDPFSLLLAKEANLFVRDAGFAKTLRGSLEAAMQGGAREMLAAEVAAQPLHFRLLRWLSYGLLRLLVGLTGYGRHDLPTKEQPADVASAGQAQQ